MVKKFGAPAIALAFAMTVAGCSSDIPYVDIDRGLVGTWIGGLVTPAVTEALNSNGQITTPAVAEVFRHQQRIIVTPYEMRFYGHNNPVGAPNPLTDDWIIRNRGTWVAGGGVFTAIATVVGTGAQNYTNSFVSLGQSLQIQYEVVGNVLRFTGESAPNFGNAPPEVAINQRFEWRRQ